MRHSPDFRREFHIPARAVKPLIAILAFLVLLLSVSIASMVMNPHPVEAGTDAAMWP